MGVIASAFRVADRCGHSGSALSPGLISAEAEVGHGPVAVVVWRRGLSRLLPSFSGGAHRGQAVAASSRWFSRCVDHLPGLLSVCAALRVSLCALVCGQFAMDFA